MLELVGLAFFLLLFQYGYDGGNSSVGRAPSHGDWWAEVRTFLPAPKPKPGEAVDFTPATDEKPRDGILPSKVGP